MISIIVSIIVSILSVLAFFGAWAFTMLLTLKLAFYLMYLMGNTK